MPVVKPIPLKPGDLFKCLADDTRLRMLLLIYRHEELCVCELTEALQDSQPKISRHLGQLKTAGILKSRREGKWMFYRLNPALPAWARDLLETTHAANGDFLRTNVQQLNAMRDRPARCTT